MKLLNLPVNILVMFFAVATGFLVAQDSTRPNIILMMADDMGMGDTSAFQDFTGNSDIEQVHTPAMERLARMGVKFVDAHTPSSRCSPTRYGLLTGRYPWRNRLKHWVLFGAQGDPMIEADRPTIASFLRDHGYRTGMVGKWHVGLRYRQSDGRPAAGFQDADLRQPLLDTPLDHGFDFCRFTSRSHGTSGPEPGRKNRADQTIGPGHIHGRIAIGATADGRELAGAGDTAYVLKELGGRHSDSTLEFLNAHVTQSETQQKPFFLYYPSNSNHTPHTPDQHVGAEPVAGAALNKAGEPMDVRADYIYENDVALGRLLKWLGSTADPRSPGQMLLHNTLVIFTSDNGAEKNSDVATGPFRSHKGSCFEGGHRVPFIAAWPAGKIGDGNPETPGATRQQLLCLTDMFATFAQILNEDLPNNASGQKGAEDSFGMLQAMQIDDVSPRPVFFHDHKEAKPDPAIAVLRLDNPVVDGTPFPGQWKLFMDAQLLRKGRANPMELYNLTTDSRENTNVVSDPQLEPLVQHLASVAMRHRTSGGHRLAESASEHRIMLNWGQLDESDHRQGITIVQLAERFHSASAAQQVVEVDGVKVTIAGVDGSGQSSSTFHVNPLGMGISSGRVHQVDDGDALLVWFDQDVIVESASLVAGKGVCGGYYKVGEGAPLAIYCIDGDIDAKDQSGILSDIGVVRQGQTLRLDSSPHYGVETPGRWRLGALTIRLLQPAVTDGR